jgi:16S rRNA G966 N2-methylase RsmD
MIILVQKAKLLIKNLAAIKGELNTFQKTTESYYENTQKLLMENNWCNVFNSAIRGNVWFYDVPLNVGRWAGNYSFFYVLFRILNDTKPLKILELGLGESTKMIQAYIKNYNQTSSCTSIEHSLEWIEVKKKSGISEKYINIVQVELAEEIVNECQTIRYSNLVEVLSERKEKYNLIIIDGPLGSDCFSRSNIIDIVQNGLLNDEFIIIMDDVNRKGEQETSQVLINFLNKRGYIFHVGHYSGEKDQLIIVSKELKYLTSL